MLAAAASRPQDDHASGKSGVGNTRQELSAPANSIVRSDGALASAQPVLALLFRSVYSTHMNSADLIRKLKSKGFALVSVRGSHHKYRNAAGVTVIIPHPRKDLGKGLLAAICKQAGL